MRVYLGSVDIGAEKHHLFSDGNHIFATSSSSNPGKKISGLKLAIQDNKTGLVIPSDQMANYIQPSSRKQCCLIPAILNCCDSDRPQQEMEAASNFLDEVLRTKEEMSQVINESITSTETIAETMQQLSDWPHRSQKLYEDFLKPCLSFIEQGNKQRAILMYQLLVMHCENLLEPDLVDY